MDCPLSIGTHKKKTALRAAAISISAFSLMAAWNWEHCYDSALDIIGEVYDMGYGGLSRKHPSDGAGHHSAMLHPGRLPAASV